MTSFVCSNCQWSRQYVDAPFFSRFAPAIELDLEGPTFGDMRDASAEDANIRAAQAILFRSRSKPSPLQDEHSKATPRRLGPSTPNKKVLEGPINKSVVVVGADATPVKMAMNGASGTPNRDLSASGSKQRLQSVSG